MKENFKAALIGKRNPEVREYLTYFINVGNLEKVNGKVELRASLMNFDVPMALGVDAWDQGEHCTAKVTHDLKSFYVRDLTSLIQKIRIN